MGKVKVWFDEEGDFLEVSFARRKGTFREVGPTFTSALIPMAA
jgi:hypothetical protein